MAEEIEGTVVGWEEAVKTANFIKLEEDKEKTIVITNWKNIKKEKFGERVVEFTAEVIEEDDQNVNKIFTTSSNRLKTKLQPILQPKEPQTKVKLIIVRMGKEFNTQYSVREVKE